MDQQELKRRFDRHPYGALAAALGAGYVLGGGFFTPLTERIAKLALKAGIRAALVPLAGQLTELFTPGEKRETTPSAPPAQRADPPHQDAA